MDFIPIQNLHFIAFDNYEMSLVFSSFSDELIIIKIAKNISELRTAC